MSNSQKPDDTKGKVPLGLKFKVQHNGKSRNRSKEHQKSEDR